MMRKMEVNRRASSRRDDVDINFNKSLFSTIVSDAYSPKSPRVCSHDEVPENAECEFGYYEKQKQYYNILRTLSSIPEWVYERLTDEKKEFHVKMIEIREGKSRLKVRFDFGDQSYQMFFSDDTIPIDLTEVDRFLTRKCRKLAAFRAEILCLPREMRIEKIVICSSVDLEVEDAFLEGMFLKRWSAVTLEYHIVHPLPSSQHLNRLSALFHPSEILLYLDFGAYDIEKDENSEKSHSSAFHCHSFVTGCDSGKVEIDSKLSSDIWKKITEEERKDRIFRVGSSYQYGRNIRWTMRAIYDFVMFATFAGKTYQKTVRKNLEKLVIRGPHCDTDCQQYARTVGKLTLLANKELIAKNEMVPLCIRYYPNISPRNEITVALALNRFIVPIDDDTFVDMSRKTKFFHCFFQTTVTMKGVIDMVQEWIDNLREIEDINVHVIEMCEELFVNTVKCDASDPKWFKIRRAPKEGMKKGNLYVGRDKPKMLCLRFHDGK